MTTEIQMINGVEAPLWNTMKSTLYPGVSDEMVHLVLDYCRAAKLDPMLKPVHVVSMWNKNLKRMVDTIMPGIGLYRIQAARTNQYAGKSEPVYGEDVTETIGKTTVTYPKYCSITVYKLIDGKTFGFTAKEHWKENFASTKEGDVNSMWLKRPHGQLAKCTEAQAMRMAFPESITSQPTAEEMEGKTIDITNTVKQSATVYSTTIDVSPQVMPDLSDRPITIYNSWTSKEMEIMPSQLSLWIEAKLKLIHTQNEMDIMETFLLTNKPKLTAWAKLSKDNKAAWLAFHSGLAVKRKAFADDTIFEKEMDAEIRAEKHAEEPEVEIEMPGDSEYQDAIRC